MDARACERFLRVAKTVFPVLAAAPRPDTMTTSVVATTGSDGPAVAAARTKRKSARRAEKRPRAPRVPRSDRTECHLVGNADRVSSTARVALLLFFTGARGHGPNALRHRASLVRRLLTGIGDCGPKTDRRPPHTLRDPNGGWNSYLVFLISTIVFYFLFFRLKQKKKRYKLGWTGQIVLDFTFLKSSALKCSAKNVIRDSSFLF